MPWNDPAVLLYCIFVLLRIVTCHIVANVFGCSWYSVAAAIVETMHFWFCQRQPLTMAWLENCTPLKTRQCVLSNSSIEWWTYKRTYGLHWLSIICNILILHEYIDIFLTIVCNLTEPFSPQRNLPSGWSRRSQDLWGDVSCLWFFGPLLTKSFDLVSTMFGIWGGKYFCCCKYSVWFDLVLNGWQRFKLAKFGLVLNEAQRLNNLKKVSSVWFSLENVGLVYLNNVWFNFSEAHRKQEDVWI